MKNTITMIFATLMIIVLTGCFEKESGNGFTVKGETLTKEQIGQSEKKVLSDGDSLEQRIDLVKGKIYAVNLKTDIEDYNIYYHLSIKDTSGETIYTGNLYLDEDYVFKAEETSPHTLTLTFWTNSSSAVEEAETELILSEIESVNSALDGLWYLSAGNHTVGPYSGSYTLTSPEESGIFIRISGDSLFSYYGSYWNSESGEDDTVRLDSSAYLLAEYWLFDSEFFKYEHSGSSLRFNYSINATGGNTFGYTIYQKAVFDPLTAMKNAPTKTAAPANLQGVWYTSKEVEVYVDDDGPDNFIFEEWVETASTIDEANEIHIIKSDSVISYYLYQEGLRYEVDSSKRSWHSSWLSDAENTIKINGHKAQISWVEPGYALIEELAKYDGPLLPEHWKNAVLPVPINKAKAVSLNTLFSGSINDDWDWYALDAQSFRSYFIEITQANFDTEIYVYDANANELAYNDDYIDLLSGVNFTPSASDTYYIGVKGLGSEDNGSYTLKITETNDAPQTNRLSKKAQKENRKRKLRGKPTRNKSGLRR